MDSKKTRTKILECAEKLLQEKGYRGWSYQDIACEIGIRKSSIHYHFPFKEDLGCALVVVYNAKLRQALLDIEALAKSPKERLYKLISLFAKVVSQPQMYCLCGMLAADYPSLDPKIQQELRGVFGFLENWVAQNLICGEKEGLWRCSSDPELMACIFVASLEGMLLMCRLKNGKEGFLQMATEYMNRFLFYKES